MAVVLLLIIIAILGTEAYTIRKKWKAEKAKQEPKPELQPQDFVDATSVDEDDPNFEGFYGIKGKEK